MKELLKPALAKFNDFLEEKVENIDQKISDLNNEVKNEEKETELLKVKYCLYYRNMIEEAN
ncbi:hypothetical protein SDC49_17890 [Lactobacillus sp. R2/2]|nr:hypothetical protein [Lactobacillus sp. R2/2]